MTESLTSDAHWDMKPFRISHFGILASGGGERGGDGTAQGPTYIVLDRQLSAGKDLKSSNDIL